MAPPSDLREIGLDGFALIDRFFGACAPAPAPAPAPRIRPVINNRVFPAPQGRWVVHQVPYDEMEDPAASAMNSREIAACFGGVMVVDYPRGRPQARVGRSRKP